MPTFTGTSADETLTGTDDADVLIGNGGYDTLIGRGGNDVMDGFGVMAGGDGDDRFVLRVDPGGREGLLTGGNGVDTIDLGLILVPAVNSATIGTARVVADGEDILATLATASFRAPQVISVNWSVRANGVERIIGFAGLTPRTTGSIAYDFTGRNSAIEILGGAERETIRGGAGADLLDGGAGDDDIYVGRGDRAFGGTGNDNLAVTSSDLTFVASIDGGAGSDTLLITLNSALSDFDLRTSGIAAAPIRGMESVFLIQSTSYAGQSVVMTLTGDAGDNALGFSREAGAAAIATNIIFRAGAGNDVVTSSGTDDSLFGEAGNDQLTGTGLLDGGDGNDVLSGNGRLLGGDGDDQITVRSTRTFTTGAVVSVGANEVVGGAGIDTFRLDTYYDQVISLRTGTATATSNTGSSLFRGTITLSGIENVIGGEARDRIEGDDGVNEIRGGYGADILLGGGGDDILYAFGPATSFETSADQLYGEDGDDLMYGSYGSDTLDGGAGDDIAYGSGGNDTLLGGDGDDVLYGQEDGDRLEGGAGADRLDGGSSADTLIGGAGDDVLTGGSGSDVIDGGDGVDIARFDFSVELATFTNEGAFIRVAVPGDSDLLTGIEYLVFNDAILTVGADGRIVTTRPAATNGTQNADVLNGTGGDDFIIGLGAADVIRGGAGNDALSGGAGNDLLYGGSGINVLDGGDGSDTAGYSGMLGSYSAVSRTYVGGGIEGARDSLTSIEVLRFLDGRLTFDITDIATTSLYRIYDAAFDRAPDVFGLADYSRAINEGRLTLQQILDTFAASGEFQARYGALSNDQFVRDMYRFSLNREGDAGGIASYVTALENGTTTRAQVLGIFSESQEHRNLINAVILNQGVFVQDEQTASVARLYDSVFSRLPDLGGLKAYREALDNGYTLKDVATVLIGSPEFQTRFGALTNQQFVEQIYRFVLDRDGDAAGIQSYVQALNNGFSRTDVVLVLSDSQEHRLSYQATYDSQIRRLGVDGYDPSGSGVGRAAAESGDKHHDAFVLPAEPAFDAVHHDDAVAVLETAANDHGLIDDAQLVPSALLDFLIATDDLSAGLHRSDWM